MSYTGDSVELQIKLVFSNTLKRYPSDTELITYTNQINNGTITIDEIEVDLKSTKEYLVLTNNYHGDFTYNATSSSESTVYNMTLSNYPSDANYSSNYNGVMLANGKIGLITSNKPNRTNHTFITTSFDFNKIGHYNNNVLEAYTFTNYDLFKIDWFSDSNVVKYTNLKQNLNMYNGTFTTTYDVSLNNSNNIQVESKMCSLQQYPYCVMQTITMTNTENYDINLDFFHHIQSKDTTIQNNTYHNNVINHSKTNNTLFFNAQGNAVHDHTNIGKICVNNCYLYDSNESIVDNYGFNMNKSNTNHAYNHLNMKLNANSQFTFTILSCMMTEKDFEHPEIETTRILLNILNKTSNEISIEHNLEWSKLWRTRFVIEERDGITEQEVNDINSVRRTMYYSLYNIYSMIRDDINVEINPLNLSTLDIDGNVFWNSDLWLVPSLLFLKPKAAKTLLNYRYTQLERAKKLASAHGFKGSKFPYETDSVGYTDLYWNSISPLHIFNTALISINAWNYFRVTRDKDWLRTIGYKILKNNADFFQSKSEYDSVLDAYVIKNVIAYNNTEGDNNMMTNYLAKLAIKYALEASYELNYIPDSKWSELLNMYFPINNNVSAIKQPSGADIYVNLELKNNIYTYVFYNGTNENSVNSSNLIGWQFGYHYYNMYLNPTTTYTFHLSTNLVTKPIVFLDSMGNQISASSGSDALTSINIHNSLAYYGGTFIIQGNSVKSYQDFSSEYLSDFGYNAFSTTADKIFVDILKLDDTYNNEQLSIQEQYIVLFPYYSRHFFTLSDNFDRQTLKHNLIYNNDKLNEYGETLTLNTLLKSTIYSKLAQEETYYDKKSIYIETFYNILLDMLNKNTNRPWYNWVKSTTSTTMFNDITISSVFLLTLITSLSGLKITGSINESRYYTEEYDIKQKSGFVLPRTWKSLQFKGVAGDVSKSFTINNNIYLDKSSVDHTCSC